MISKWTCHFHTSHPLFLSSNATPPPSAAPPPPESCLSAWVQPSRSWAGPSDEALLTINRSASRDTETPNDWHSSERPPSFFLRRTRPSSCLRAKPILGSLRLSLDGSRVLALACRLAADWRSWDEEWGKEKICFTFHLRSISSVDPPDRPSSLGDPSGSFPNATV